MVTLALPLLFLAAASDSEDSNEEAWTRRFAEVDAKRAKYGIEPLSPQERMAWMIGTSPPLPSYGLMYSRADLWGNGVYTYGIRFYKVAFRRGTEEFSWRYCIEDDVHRNEIKWCSDSILFERQLSEDLRIPILLAVQGQGSRQYRYADDPPSKWRVFPK